MYESDEVEEEDLTDPRGGELYASGDQPSDFEGVDESDGAGGVGGMGGIGGIGDADGDSLPPPLSDEEMTMGTAEMPYFLDNIHFVELLMNCPLPLPSLTVIQCNRLQRLQKFPIRIIAIGRASIVPWEYTALQLL
jgi:hypothetical protein